MDIIVGQKAHRELTVTEQMVQAYAEISGDYNPLHFDLAFTSRTRFEKLIAQGGITTGLLHALVAMDMPGPGTVFMSQSWRFTGPVFIGDTIRAEASVRSIHESKPSPISISLSRISKGMRSSRVRLPFIRPGHAGNRQPQVWASPAPNSNSYTTEL